MLKKQEEEILKIILGLAPLTPPWTFIYIPLLSLDSDQARLTLTVLPEVPNKNQLTLSPR